MEVFVAQDRLSASLHLEARPIDNPPTEPVPVPESTENTETIPAMDGLETTKSDVRRLLVEQGVIFGIDDASLHQALAAWLESGQEKTTVIAQGIKERNGQNATIQLLFVPPPKLVVNAEKQVNHRNHNFVVNVLTGTPLAQMKHATPGTPGMDVLGQEIPPVAGVPLTVEITPLVKEDVHEELGITRYEAAQDGMLQEFSPSKILLTDHLEIRQNIDQTTGNIEAWGSLTITGNITPDWIVRARGDIQVTGGVESSYLEVGGNLMVQGGFFGRAEATEAKVGKKFEGLFVQNAKLVVQGDTTIHDSVVNSHLYVDGNLSVTERHGSVLTSRLVASGDVNVRTLGSPNEQAVEVVAGSDPKIWQQIIRLKREQLQYRSLFLRGFLKQPKRPRPFPKTMHILRVRKIKSQRTAAIMERVLLRRQQAVINALKKSSQLPCVRVAQKTYRNTRITIGLYTLKVTEELSGGTFRPDLEQRKIIWSTQ